MKRSEWGVTVGLLAIVIGANVVIAVVVPDYWVRLLAGMLRYGLVMTALAAVGGLVWLYRWFME